MSDEQLIERLRELASPPYDSACFGGALLKAADAIERLEAELAREEEESEHYVRVAFVDPGANPPIAWKDRAEKAERELAEARAEIERVRTRLEWAHQRLDVDFCLTKKEQAYTATKVKETLEALAAPAPEPDWTNAQNEEELKRLLVDEPATEREAERRDWPVAGSIWEHANGNRYVIVAMANIEPGKEDKFPLSVIYRNTLRDTLYVRRMSDWPGRMTLAAQQQALESDDTKIDLVDRYIASELDRCDDT